MRKTTLLKTILLLCALIVGSGSVWAQTFTKITSISEVTDGGSYLFVYENGASSVAMSTTQNNNNRAKVDVTISDNKIEYASGVEVVTLESTGTANQYYLRGSNGKYLIAVSGSNYLKSNDTKIDAGKFTFAYSESVLSITSTLPAGNTSTWNPSQLRYNYSGGSGGQVFSCYGTGQGAITLFKENIVPFENTSKGKDVLTYSTLNLTGSNGYRDFSGVSSTSSAVYAGKANKGSIDFIQLNSTNPAGIVTTATGGKVRKVVIDWNAAQANTDGRYVEIYGKNTAYETGADLYDNEKKGTLLGSIKYGTSTDLRVLDDYAYIGIKASGAVYMQSVTITWEGDAVSLSDASNYSPVAKDYAKVTLDRSFVAGWNGIVLPFDLTADVQTALGATEVKTLDSATDTGSGITIGFADASLPVDAGTPVLVKLSAAKASGDVTINGVELKTTTPTTIEKSAGGSTFTLTGTYSTTDLTSSEVYLVSNMKFYHKAASVALTAQPFRAYIVQTGEVPARIGFDLEDGGTTGIIEVNAMRSAGNEAIYNVAGQRVEKAQRGLYIVNGKKVIK